MELVGRPAMFRDELPGACFQNTLIRFRASEYVVPEYALQVFVNYLHSGEFQQVATRSVNIAHLGAGRLARMHFPLAPLTEQRRIVSKIIALTGQADDIQRNMERASRTVARLDQTVLARAFRGEL
jgi:type I restriction enzyme S subunit